VSLSLGCSAVFLMGGPGREQRPSAIMLHSGDLLVLAGPARGCYHGGPGGWLAAWLAAWLLRRRGALCGAWLLCGPPPAPMTSLRRAPPCRVTEDPR
jgi:hypothetical protein